MKIFKLLIICFILIILMFLLLFYKKKPATLSPRPSPNSSINLPTQVGNIPNWNQQFNNEITQYIDAHKIQDNALIKIRRSAPIKQPDFTINYSYKNSTYTINGNKNQAINWLKDQGVTNLGSIRIVWKQ